MAIVSEMNFTLHNAERLGTLLASACFDDLHSLHQRFFMAQGVGILTPHGGNITL